jgi:transcriptional regulator with XRE-family HTH domain
LFVLPPQRLLGDHLRKRRLDLGLLQAEVADRLGVTESSVTNWELSRTEPELRFLPGIVRFLGYTPWSVDRSIGERLEPWRAGNVGPGFRPAGTHGWPKPFWRALIG